MLASRPILEFNRLFAPNPFNSGPPIPALSTRPESSPWAISSASVAPLTHINEPEALRDDVGTPDLTNSPSSSVSSMTLDDEEIRKIFSPSRIRHLDWEAQQSGDLVNQTSRKDELNPEALPFVPSFFKYSSLHNPIANSVDADFTYAPPPLELDLQPLDFASPPTADPQETPLLDCSPHPRTVSLPPLHPPGLPHPPIHSVLQEDHNDPGPQCPPPQYLPVLLDALKRGRTTREREVLAGVIVNIVDDWNMDSILELAERIGMEACDPTADLPDGQDVPQMPAAIRPSPPANESDGEQSPQTKVAELARALNQHFNRHHVEVGQFFCWNLRETVLTRFNHFWDCEKPKAIAFGNYPSPQYVQSALTLSKSIAAFFKEGLISRNQVSMCISLLMKNFQFIEHVEAMANLVLGCGRTFWEPSHSGPPLPAEALAVPSPDSSLLAPQSSIDPAEWQEVKQHVATFMAGLNGNMFDRKLEDQHSVIGCPWENGRLRETVLAITNTVRCWEHAIISGQ